MRHLALDLGNVRRNLSTIILLGVATVLIISPPASAKDLNCDKQVCVGSKTLGPSSKAVFVENRRVGPITLSLELSELRNAKALRAGAQTVVVRPSERRVLNEVYAVSPRQPWNYRYHYRWRHGSKDAKHDDQHIYFLPYAPGSTYPMIQGPGGSYSHTGESAYDFSMPLGTKIHAARAGRVIAVRQDSQRGGPSRAFEDEANFVYLLHNDGTIGKYVHLKFGGALVKLGQQVQAGEVLGLSGDTGFASRPHLHFEVCAPIDGKRVRTFNLWFSTKRSKRTFLAKGERYTAKHY